MNNSFKRHRFRARIILLAVRWYCRYPLSYRDVQDMLAERNIHVSRSTINRWVVKFGPEIAHKIRTLHSPRTMQWHVDETYIRISGRWRYLWRIDVFYSAFMLHSCKRPIAHILISHQHGTAVC